MTRNLFLRPDKPIRFYSITHKILCKKERTFFNLRPGPALWLKTLALTFLSRKWDAGAHETLMAPHPLTRRRYIKDNESYFLISTFALNVYVTSQGPLHCGHYYSWRTLSPPNEIVNRLRTRNTRWQSDYILYEKTKAKVHYLAARNKQRREALKRKRTSSTYEKWFKRNLIKAQRRKKTGC